MSKDAAVMTPEEARKAAGRRVQLLRAELGLNKKNFAARAKIGRALLARIEAGVKLAQLDKLASVASALSIPVTEIDPGNCIGWQYDTEQKLIQHVKQQQAIRFGPVDGLDEFSNAKTETITIIGRFADAATDFMQTCRTVFSQQKRLL
jgi:transcriptional regulator with XRE-family HTH domain